MFFDVLAGVLLPFGGTVIGASLVLIMRNELNAAVRRMLDGFAAGVMVAASVWSLLIPAIERMSYLGVLSFVPAFAGFWLGIVFLMVTERTVSRLQIGGLTKKVTKAKSTFVMVLAVALHNFPEGMAVGVVYAGLLSGDETLSIAAALALSIGIAVQNLPEGAVVSMPLRAAGIRKHKAFWYGVLSGIVEPIGAVLTIVLSGLFLPILPYFLGFAAGAMMYVVVEELIPDRSEKQCNDIGTLFFGIGFSLMMVLDVALG